MRPRAAAVLTLALAFAAPLVGCGPYEPYNRPGDWRPLGANSDNLRAMIADPADLYGGRGATGSDGALAAGPVARLRAGAGRALPNTGLTDIKVTDSGNPPPGDAAAPAPGTAPGPIDGGAAQ